MNTLGAAEETVRLTRQLLDQHPQLKVLVMGVGEDVQAIVKSVEAGAAGYVRQDDSVEALLEKVKAAAQDRAVVSPDVAARLMARLAELTSVQQELGTMVDSQERCFDALTPAKTKSWVS